MTLKAVFSKIEAFLNLEAFMNKAYSFYSVSHKRFYSLLEYAQRIGAKVIRLQKIFDIRYYIIHKSYNVKDLIPSLMGSPKP